MDLLHDYPAGYNVLPTENPHDVVNVSLQLALYHLVDMVRSKSNLKWCRITELVCLKNERAQTLTTNCEIITKWRDIFLMWDPAKYDNITETRLPWERVWTPDIVLYNAAGDGEQGREMRTLIQVKTIESRDELWSKHLKRLITRAMLLCWPRLSIWASAWWMSLIIRLICSCASWSLLHGQQKLPGYRSKISWSNLGAFQT